MEPSEDVKTRGKALLRNVGSEAAAAHQSEFVKNAPGLENDEQEEEHQPDCDIDHQCALQIIIRYLQRDRYPSYLVN